MERDDRLFAAIGSCVAIGATAIVWLALSATRAVPVAEVTSSVPSAVPPVTASAVDARPAEVSQVVRAVHRPDVVDDRDGLVRAAARRVSRHPEVLRWLVTDDLSRRMVEIVDAVADGRIPREDAAVVATEQPFVVYGHDGGFVVAAGTARRFDLMVAGLTSVDPADAAALLEDVAPELEASWSDRGGPGRFEDRLRSAVDHVLAVRIPTGPLEVERRGRYYEWADDDLRLASPAQKALLRTGGRNARAIQAWLRGFREAMEWAAPTTSQPVLMAERASSEFEPRPVGDTSDAMSGTDPVAAGTP